MKVRDYINEAFDIREEYFNIFKRAIPIGKMFCPFHDNTDTPAAKCYGNHIHCFACKRNYGVYDLFKKFDPKRIKEVATSQVLDFVKESKSYLKPIRVAVDRTLPIHKILNKIKKSYESGSN